MARPFKMKKFKAWSEFPKAARSIKFVGRNCCYWQQYIRAAALNNLAEVSLKSYDEVRAEYIFELVFQSNSRTLTKEEIEIELDKINHAQV